jgi:hypothetical protein
MPFHPLSVTITQDNITIIFMIVFFSFISRVNININILFIALVTLAAVGVISQLKVDSAALSMTKAIFYMQTMTMMVRSFCSFLLILIDS